jgi:hypothetical protein
MPPSRHSRSISSTGGAPRRLARRDVGDPQGEVDDPLDQPSRALVYPHVAGPGVVADELQAQVRI